MKFDVFFSICQTEVDGHIPSERVMFENFFDQVKLADELTFGVAWVAETHLSCEIQKKLPSAVIPHFKGEIGLNTDILQVAHKIFAMTKRIEVGSAIRNILCNGGPIAHAEALRTFLALHGLNSGEKRRLHFGFASGRFEFSNRPYGIVPRNALESLTWPVVKGKILAQATEIFLKLVRGDELSSNDVTPMILQAADFRSESEWQAAWKMSAEFPDTRKNNSIHIPSFYEFEKLGVIPREVRMELLQLVIGTHDPRIQKLANEILPTGVFNLSITPPTVIEETHERMKREFHAAGGPWSRAHMPRTAMVFSSREEAKRAWQNYWKAMEGTLDSKKVDEAVHNALIGTPDELAEQIKNKYHPEDRLMLWFDFNNHDNEAIKRNMRSFMTEVVPRLMNSGERR